MSVNLFDIKNESDIDIEISLISRSTYNSNFTVSFNDQLLSDIEMDIIKDRGVWIFLTVLTLLGLYYWTVVDQDRVEKMGSLQESDFTLSGDVNEWSEVYNRLELKYIGISKHVKTLQDETNEHYKAYNAKVDSINSTFERLEFKLDQINESLTDRLEDLNESLESLSEEFSSYKRTTQRDVRKINKSLESIKEDIDTIKKELDD